MFSDSQIARKFACGRTTTTVIIKNALALSFTRKQFKIAGQSHFSQPVMKAMIETLRKLLLYLSDTLTINQAVIRYLTNLNKFLCKFSVYIFYIEYPFFISVILTLDFTSFLLTVHYVRKYTRNTWTSVMLTLQKHCSEALLNQVAES